MDMYQILLSWKGNEIKSIGSCGGEQIKLGGRGRGYNTCCSRSKVGMVESGLNRRN